MLSLVLTSALYSSAALAEDDAPEAPEPPITITLQDPGRGCRRRLALAPVPGDAWQVQIRRTSSNELSIDHQDPVARTAPAATHELQATVTDTDTRLALTDADLDGAELATSIMLRKQVEGLADLRFVLPHDPHARAAVQLDGFPDEIEEIAGELIGDVGWALKLIRLPLPEVRVGRGATWTWTVQGVEQGTPLIQTFTATLVQRRGRQARVTVALSWTSPPVADPEVEIVDTLQGTGEAQFWLDTRRALPSAVTVHVDGALTSDWDSVDEHELTVARHIEGTFEVDLTVATR